MLEAVEYTQPVHYTLHLSADEKLKYQQTTLTIHFHLPRTPLSSLAESDLAIPLPSKTDPWKRALKVIETNRFHCIGAQAEHTHQQLPHLHRRAVNCSHTKITSTHSTASNSSASRQQEPWSGVSVPS